jgi:hypothetical protein
MQKRMAKRTQRVPVRRWAGVFALASPALVDTAGVEVKPVPETAEPEREASEDEPEPVMDDVAGTVFVTPSETSTIDTGTVA